MMPPARGVRIDWPALPPRMRAAIEAQLGAPVVEAVTQSAGFSPGLAARLRTADGRRAFAKAAGPDPNPTSPRVHRLEAANVAALPLDAPVPRLLSTIDEGEGGWVVLLFEDVEGRNPATPWQPDELGRVVEALIALSSMLDPSPIPAERVGREAERGAARRTRWRMLLDDPPPTLDDWSRRHLAALANLEVGAAAASDGEALCHLDMRADNILMTDDRVLFVDWPHCRVGAPWLDPVWMAPSVAMQGGPQPEAFLARFPAAQAADPDAITAFLASVAGYFTWHALQPPPPGLPTLRPFQAAQGEAARAWLARRTGLA